MRRMYPRDIPLIVKLRLRCPVGFVYLSSREDGAKHEKVIPLIVKLRLRIAFSCSAPFSLPLRYTNPTVKTTTATLCATMVRPRLMT